MTKGSKEIEMPSILDTGANSEGGVYRETLGSQFEIAGLGGEAAAVAARGPSITFANGAICAWCAARWTTKSFKSRTSIS